MKARQNIEHVIKDSERHIAPTVMGKVLGYKEQTCLYCIVKVMGSSSIYCHTTRPENMYRKKFDKNGKHIPMQGRSF